MGAYMNGMQVLYEKVRTLASLTPTRRQSAEVPENTSKVSGRSILVAEAVGRSALVVAYNQINETGLVGRFLDTRLGRDRNNPDEVITEGGRQFDRALGRIAGLGPSSATYLWIGGVSSYNEAGDEVPEAFAERRYIRSRIDGLAAHFADLAPDWTQEAHENVRVQLSPQMGTLSVERIRLPGHFLDQIIRPES
jgi:hypothetical protein